jgi:hypothetical protein
MMATGITEARMPNRKSCQECGTRLTYRSKICPTCGASVYGPPVVPGNQVAGETERGLVDVELASKRVARFIRYADTGEADPPEMLALW